jgi:hypothetical protein
MWQNLQANPIAQITSHTPLELHIYEMELRGRKWL